MRDKEKKRIADQLRRSTPEYKAKKNALRRAALREKAAAEGREVRKWRLTPEERPAARKARWNKYKQGKLEQFRKEDAERAKKRRAAKALAEGRKPGLIGRERVLTDEQRKENARLINLAYRKNNPEKIKELTKNYYQAHKQETQARVRKRRAMKAGNGGTHTAADIRALWFEQKGRCGLCEGALDEKKYDVGHWKPISKGGSNDKSNLKLLHPACNKSKGAKLPSELIKGVL